MDTKDILNSKTKEVRNNAREEMSNRRIAEISLIAHENAINRYMTIIKMLIVGLLITNIFWSIMFVTHSAVSTTPNNTTIELEDGNANYIGSNGDIHNESQ